MQQSQIESETDDRQTISPAYGSGAAVYHAAAPDNKADGDGPSMSSQVKKLWMAFTAVLVFVVTNAILLPYFAATLSDDMVNFASRDWVTELLRTELGLWDHLGPRVSLDLQGKEDPWGRLDLGLPDPLDLPEKRDPWGRLDLGLPDPLDLPEKRDTWGRLDLCLLVPLDLPEKRGSWGRLDLGLPVPLDLPEKRDPWGWLDLCLLVSLDLPEKRGSWGLLDPRKWMDHQEKLGLEG
ncbi:Hypp3226 [Branchiostoma lanceolatum]|uniref:Hypp3226 protein n=1 Tax=Branchiostoma lanceolatum TaxID=7740 RepID=A0A8K0ETF7_BRALA|nr:Hypp3226 [Branchiostoma lanceolatum]